MIQVFNALSDPTRFAVVERLSQGELSVSELAEPFEMALPSFMQHLRVLEDCGLVTSTKKGRVRYCRLQGAKLKDAESWLSVQRRRWETRLNQLDDYLSTMDNE